MSGADDMLRNAQECLQMADHSRRDRDKAAWLRVAESWLRLAGDREPSPHFAWPRRGEQRSQTQS